MKIKYLIDTILSPKLTALSFVDRYASIVRTINIAETDSGIIKRYPVSCDVSAVDCVNTGLYQDLVPNDTKTSVVYWEMMQPMSNIGFTRTNDFYQKRFRGTARLVVWLNLAKLGIDNCTSSLELIPIIEKELTTKGKIIGGIYDGNLLWIQPRSMVKQDINIVFGNYDYNKLKNYYLYPFDFFAIDVEFTMEQCLSKGGEFPTLPAIDCPNSGAGILACKSFDFDGVNEYIANGIYPSPFAGNENFLFNNDESFSFSIWFNMDNFTGSQTPLISTGNFSVQLGYQITIISGSGQIRFLLTSGIFTSVTGSFLVQSNQSVLINSWNNVICTYDGSQDINGMKIYINGFDSGYVLSNVTGTGLADDISYPTTPLKIMRGKSTATSNGKLNNIRIWKDAALTPAEALDEYNSGKPKFTAQRFSKLVLDLDIQNAAYTGTEYEVVNKTGLGDNFIAYNTEIEDLIQKCP